MLWRRRTCRRIDASAFSDSLTRPRFLIDECLSVELVRLASDRGFEASHLRDRGLLGFQDRALVPLIVAGDWCFVTRNARDFRGSEKARGEQGAYAFLDLHAGLICLHGDDGFDIERQREAFAVALDEVEALEGCDPMNLLIEITWRSDEEGLLSEIFELPPRR